jgi:hypothetical protein
MNRYEARLTGVLVDDASPPDPEILEGMIDAAVAELETLGAEDIDVSTNLGTGEFTVAISVEADDLPEGVLGAGGMIRTAFHTAGAATPHWSVNWVQARLVQESRQDLLDA